MKLYLKQHPAISVFSVIGILTLSLLFIFASGQVSMVLNAGTASVNQVKTFANSQVDTVNMPRDRAVALITFAAHWKDSVSITRAVVERMIDGQVMPRVAGDTLAPFTTFQALTNEANPDTSQAAAITMNPLADVYRVIVTYAGSNNGTSKNTVKYQMNRQYNTSP